MAIRKAAAHGALVVVCAYFTLLISPPANGLGCCMDFRLYQPYLRSLNLGLKAVDRNIKTSAADAGAVALLETCSPSSKTIHHSRPSAP